MSLNEQFQFFLPMQFYHHRLLGFPTKTKKILEPKINPPPHPQPSPEIFREGLNDTARQKIESNCLWFVYQSYHLPNLSFSSDSPNCTASIVRARYSTNSYLNKGITKRSYIFIFAKISYRQRNSLVKNFKTKKEIPLSSW